MLIADAGVVDENTMHRMQAEAIECGVVDPPQTRNKVTKYCKINLRRYLLSWHCTQQLS